MSFFDLLLMLVLLLTCYYVIMIVKEIIRKDNSENEMTKSAEDQEIDITEDLVHFDVTEIDPSDILVEDTLINVKKQPSCKDQESGNTEVLSIPILPFPMEVTKFHKIIQEFDPDNPNPELETILFTISEKPDP